MKPLRNNNPIAPFHIDLTGAHKDLTANLARTAARAVIYNDKGSLLMLRSNRGDYKFPGGGLEENETWEDALKREVKEETGYLVEVGKQIGSAIERRRDFYDPGLIFEMVSHYYACTLKGKAETPALSGYEKTLDLRAGWVDPLAALSANEAVSMRLPWVRRETEVLKRLLESNPKE